MMAQAIRAILRSDRRRSPHLARAVWSNYKKEIDAWHGALEHKDSYTWHFMHQDAASLAARAYDISKLTELLDALIAEALQLR